MILRSSRLLGGYRWVCSHNKEGETFDALLDKCPECELEHKEREEANSSALAESAVDAAWERNR